ncbi:gag-polypeptide of LTR copia-type [Artemisia annua]|uniref:Gag-polypeptide of LTR copia-type n=1 Tax=Artemisia annua TaxID=35608 RepID=A0A2U1KKK7_ARTAN|nr:gag-polypeptide of LTR copia-type [Artemisia annua]
MAGGDDKVGKGPSGSGAFVSRTNPRNSSWSANKNSLFNNNQPRKLNRPNLVCTHCKMNGHTVDRCFELVGYPTGFQKKNGFNQNNARTSDEPYDDKREKEPIKVSEKSSEGIDPSSLGDSPVDVNKDEVEHPDVTIDDVINEKEENATLDDNDKLSEGDDDYYQEFNDMFHETIITPVVTPERLANMRTYKRYSSRKCVPPVKLSDYVLDGKEKYGIDKSVNYRVEIKLEGLKLTRVKDEGL